MVIGTHRPPVAIAPTFKMICYIPFLMNHSHHIKRFIVSNPGMNLVPIQERNDNPDTECNIYVDSDSELNVVEEVNMSEAESVP